MKHRYIFCGVVWDHPEICNYRLISKPTYSHGEFVRVNIPDDLELSHYSGDGYSTTYDKRTIHELGCDCYILYKGKWRKFNYLKNFEPHMWFRVLEHIFGVRNCYDEKIGWTDDIKQWSEIFRSKERIEMSDKCSRNEYKMHYPPVREDKKGLKLKVNLDKDVDFFRNSHGEKEWLNVYDQFKKELEENPDKEIWCE
jgi:hypothetical protein